MTVVFLILIVIISILLCIIILIQNPKGGGLAGTFGGVGNQMMGVQQTNNVLEKGTWILAGLICFLSIISVLFFSSGTSAPGSDVLKNLNTSGSSTIPAPAPNTAQPNNAVPLLPADSGK